jgi:hypothetical protein
MAGARPRARRGTRPDVAAARPHQCSGSWNGKLHGTITVEADGWVAYVRLEAPPGLSPITTVGQFVTVEAAQVATDEVCGRRDNPRRSAVLCLRRRTSVPSDPRRRRSYARQHAVRVGGPEWHLPTGAAGAFGELGRPSREYIAEPGRCQPGWSL